MADESATSSSNINRGKLQELTLPTPEAHDNTTPSDIIRLKQFEEKLRNLRKENFQLKLMMFEEKVSTGASPTIQNLLDRNVKLQVGVEELRRQLTYKQELLAAAAEPINVLEKQGPVSNDGVEASMINTVPKKEAKSQDVEKKEIGDECAESEFAVNTQEGEAVNNGELVLKQDELARLQRDYFKALQMIKRCVKIIQQQDKEIKKLQLNKQLEYAHVSDSQIDKFEEMLKLKDEHIKDLEDSIKKLQQCNNVQSHDSSGCMLGEDMKLAKIILEESFKPDESVALEDFTLENMDFTESFIVELDVDNKSFDVALFDEMAELTKRIDELEDEKKDLNSKYDHAMTQIQDLIAENEDLKTSLALERICAAEVDKKKTEDLSTKVTILTLKSKINEIQQQLQDTLQVIEKMRLERQELEAILKAERSARRAAVEERVPAQHDRLRLERELSIIEEEMNATYTMSANAQLEM